MVHQVAVEPQTGIFLSPVGSLANKPLPNVEFDVDELCQYYNSTSMHHSRAPKENY